MIEVIQRFARTYMELGWPVKVALLIVVPILTFLFGVVLALYLPADYFVRKDPGPTKHPTLRLIVRMAKNLVGWSLLPLGIFMALPLVPGPGLAFILIGISLMDFPGKRRLEERLLGYPPVLHAINSMRRRFGRAPVQIALSPGHRGEVKNGDDAKSGGAD